MHQPADDNPRPGKAPPARARRTPEERVVTEWRRLTGGTAISDDRRPTLIACSGGADSSALAFALGSAAAGSIVLAYIAHDIRVAATVNAESECVAHLASRLGCRFFSRSIKVRERQGNVEGLARRLRYAALLEVAIEQGCRFIATGHQATDQLETLLMRIGRGSGPQGLRGILPTRRLHVQAVDAPATAEQPHTITVIRPMLSITRRESEAICSGRGWQWSVDATNKDHSLLRNAIRHRIIPILSELSPGIEARSSRAAALQAEAAQMQDALVRRTMSRSQRTDRAQESQDANPGSQPLMTLDRAELKNLSGEYGAGVVRLMLWKQIRQISPHPDRVDHQAIDPLVVAILGLGHHAKQWMIAGVEVRMNSREVTFALRG